MAKDAMVERGRRSTPERTEGILGWPGRWAMHVPDLFEWTEPHSIRVEEVRDDGHVVVRAELPGMDPEHDISVEVLDGVLTIRGERRESSEQRDRRRYRSEFRYGWFARSLALPEGCAVEDIEAKYRDGVLEVSVPVAEATESSSPIPVRIDHD